MVNRVLEQTHSVDACLIMQCIESLHLIKEVVVKAFQKEGWKTTLQDRNDVITPFEAALDLHKAFPEADVQVTPDTDHAATELGIRKALLEATAHFGKE